MKPTPPGSKGWERKRFLEPARRENYIERLPGDTGKQSSFVKGYSQPNVTSEGGTSELTSSPHSFPLPNLFWGSPLAKPYWTSLDVDVVPPWGAPGPTAGVINMEKEQEGAAWDNLQAPGGPRGHNINKSPWRTVQTNVFLYVSPDNGRKREKIHYEVKVNLKP